MQRNYLYVVGSRVSRKTRNQRTGSVKLSSSNKQLGLRKRLGSWDWDWDWDFSWFYLLFLLS
jgi:hypothetical protein